MRKLNFVLGFMFVMMFAMLSQLNTGSPNKGWIIGVLIMSIAWAFGVAVGLVNDMLVAENGAFTAAGVATVALSVILAPAFFFHGWIGVAFSAALLIFWERLCRAH